MPRSKKTTTTVTFGPKVKPAKAKRKRSKKSKNVSAGTMVGRMMNPSRAPRKSMPMLKDEHSDMLASMCDPWGTKALGCKYPDGYSSTSLAAQSRMLINLSTLASQTSNIYTFNPSFPYSYCGVTTISAGAGTWGTYAILDSTSLAYTLVASDNAQYRPVCAGLVIRSLQNAMVAQGTLIVTKVPHAPSSGGTWQQGQIVGESRVFPIVSGMEIPVFFKPVGSGAYQFVPGNSATTVNGGWDSVVLDFSACSADATVIFSIDMIVNYELELSNASYQYQQFASRVGTDDLV